MPKRKLSLSGDEDSSTNLADNLATDADTDNKACKLLKIEDGCHGSVLESTCSDATTAASVCVLNGDDSKAVTDESRVHDQQRREQQQNAEQQQQQQEEEVDTAADEDGVSQGAAVASAHCVESTAAAATSPEAKLRRESSDDGK